MQIVFDMNSGNEFSQPIHVAGCPAVHDACAMGEVNSLYDAYREAYESKCGFDFAPCAMVALKPANNGNVWIRNSNNTYTPHPREMVSKWDDRMFAIATDRS